MTNQTEENRTKFYGGFGIGKEILVSDQILMAIGCTVIRQSQIELTLAQMIHVLLSIDLSVDPRKGQIEPDRAYALTAGMSFRSLCSALSALMAQSVDDESYQEFKKWLGKLQRFEEFRNQIAHSDWARSHDYDPQRGIRQKITAKHGKGVKHHREEITVSRVSAELEKARIARFRLESLITSLYLDRLGPEFFPQGPS